MTSKINAPVSPVSQDVQAQAEIVNLLRQRWLDAQLKREGYSLRRFASRVRVAAPILSELFNGKRKVTRKLALQIFDGLGTEPDLVQKLLARLPEKQVRRKRASTKKTQVNYIQLITDEFRMVADWYYIAILSLAETEGFRSDPTWIGKRLGITQEQAASAVQTLLRLGLLSREPHGRLSVTGKRFSTTNSIPDASIRKNHIQSLELARQAIDEVPMELREISASVIAADPDLLPEAKSRIKELRREIARILEGGRKREVYRLSVQLIPLTKGSHS